jgi:phenylacetic acid degradation operon negative regulatory protein
MGGGGNLELAPLPARSVVLSLMLGVHPNRITTRQVTRVGEYFGIAAATLRVALTRAVASGDLQRDGTAYVLGPRLAARQRHQDEAVEDASTPWDGEWEMAVVVVSGRAGQARATLRETLTQARLAELREGVWTRPANLRRASIYVGDPVLACFRARPERDPATLAEQLWDLDGWAATASDLAARLSKTEGSAIKLAVGAQVVRHLNVDPLLPAELRPPSWPGTLLREAYAAYQGEMQALVHSS